MRIRLTDRDDLGRKRCSTCENWRDEGEFGKNAALPDGFANACRECQWSNGLWNKYRMRGDDYYRLLAEQDGKCAVCESVPDDRRLAVDHDHRCCPGARSCGKCVRSLLCLDCNTGIGSMKDDPALLRKAIDYLEGFDGA